MSRRPPPLRLLAWRARLPLTLIVALVGAGVVVDALRADPEPHTALIVAARDLEAGTELTARDVRVERWPSRLVPNDPPGHGGSETSPGASVAGASVAGGTSAPDGTSRAPVTSDLAVGRSLAVAVPAGMPLVDGVLARENWWEGAPPSAVAAPVRLSDAELAGLLRTGDHVDVLAAGVEGGTAERVAHRALVLSGPTTSQSRDAGLFGGGAPSTSGLVLLAVTASEAAALAGHGASSVLSAVLVQ